MSSHEFAVATPRLVDIYLEAMKYDPAIRQNRIDVWRREVSQPGFAALCAVMDGRIIGLAYGYLGSPDHWWDRQIRRGLRERGGPDAGEQALLRDYFEIAEIHVLPAAQGHGVGRRMITGLLRATSASRALLSTPEVPGERNHAFSLYRSLGFTDLIRDFHFDGDRRPFAILKVTLPLVERPS